jgi:hypothetical protein
MWDEENFPSVRITDLTMDRGFKPHEIFLREAEKEAWWIEGDGRRKMKR